MASIVLRVRLTSGEHLDVSYEEVEAADEAAAAERAITTLGRQDGVLRCRHGNRLVALYARGVAALEVGPQGPVL